MKSHQIDNDDYIDDLNRKRRNIHNKKKNIANKQKKSVLKYSHDFTTQKKNEKTELQSIIEQSPQPHSNPNHRQNHL